MPRSTVACTTIGVMVFGRMWRTTIVRWLTPMERAASTKLRSRRLAATPRTSRVYQGHQDTTSASAACISPGPSAAVSAIASRSTGTLGTDR